MTKITRFSFTLLMVLTLAVGGVFVPLHAHAQVNLNSGDDIDRLVQIIEQMARQLNAGAPIDTTTAFSSTGVPQGSVLGASTVSGNACPFSWTRNLGQNAQGFDVLKLQQFLNSDQYTRVALSGAGSPGNETTFYGPATASAVAKFQAKYRSEVLSPFGLFSPTGFFGVSSRAKANALCAGVSVPAPINDRSDDNDDRDDRNDRDDDDDDRDRDNDYRELRGDEAEVDKLDLNDAADDDIEEGREDEEVAEIEIEFEDGDVLLERFDIEFTLAGGQTEAEDEPWDVFEEVSLWLDGERIASENADDEDDWLSDERTMRLSNLDTIIREGEEETIIIAVTTQNGFDLESNDTADWEVRLADDALRVEDATGDIIRFDATDPGPATFTIEEEGAEDELRVRSSSDDPDSTTLELDSDDRSDFITVFAFDLDTEDSSNDIEVTQIRVDVDATGDGSTPTSTAFLINDAQLVIDGDEFDDVTIIHGTTGQFVFDLSDEDYFIDAGDRVTVEFELEFDALDADFEGATIEASTDADVGYEAEGADDLGSGQFDGAANGEEHTLRTTGSVLEFDSEDFDFQENTDATIDDDEGVYRLRFDVTAFEQDLYLNKNAVRGTASADAGVEYLIASGGSTVLTGTEAASLSSSAGTEGGKFKVAEGETETFTLSVVYDPASSGFFALKLNNINFTDSASGVVFSMQRAIPESDFETDEYNI